MSSWRLLCIVVLCVAVLPALVVSSLQAEVPSGPGDWPQWRGPKRDGISPETGLLKQWPKEGPKVAWQVDSVGKGYSSLAIKGGRIYTQGDLAGVEHIICLDAKDGKTLWAVQPGPVAALLAAKLEADFKQIDKNKDGKIDEIEALGRFGWDWNRVNRPAPKPDLKARAEFIVAQLDKDQDGRLSWIEAKDIFRDAFEKIDAEDKAADAEAVATKRADEFLKALDKDGDGQISKAEAKNTYLDRQFGRIDQKDPATNKADEILTKDEMVASFKRHETGRDGTVSAAEIEEYLTKNNSTGDGELTSEELRIAVGGFRNDRGDGPRGTPTVDGDRVYVEGGAGDVTCLEADTGKTIWHLNLREFGGGTPGWGYSESPLVLDNLVVVTPGGKQGTLLTLDKMTGKKVWQSGGVTEGAHYSSPVLAEIHGVKQLVQFASKSVFGVTLAEGKPLWSFSTPANGTANCCDPIVWGDYVFAASAYDKGAGLARIIPAGSEQQAEEVYFTKKMNAHHGGVVKLGDYLYSNGGGALTCMEFATGEVKWQNRSAGKGALTIADGMLYILGEGHELALAEATPDEYREQGRMKLKEHGLPSWAHPVVAGGRLYIRDQESLTAFDIRQ